MFRHWYNEPHFQPWEMVAQTLTMLSLIFVMLYMYSALAEPLGSADQQLRIREDGIDIPPIGLGTWLSERKEVGPAVEIALKDGYRHIDAARAYSNEDKVGKALNRSDISRDKIWVTSKLWNTDHHPSMVPKAIKKTLKDLELSKLDLYLMHWPVAFHPHSSRLDESITILQTWKAMEDLVRTNLTRYIGVSNFDPVDLDVIFNHCEICPYAHEFETHPYLQQQEFVNWHLERDIKVIAYSPLANTNPHYDSGLPSILKDPFWVDLADKKNATVAQTVLAWGMQRNTSVIPKSVHSRYIEQNLASLDIVLTEDEMKSVSGQDRKWRMNDPGKAWGVSLFRGLDDPTWLQEDDIEL